MMKARVLVADALPSEAFEEVRALGAEVLIRPEIDADTLVAAIPGVKVLVVRSTRVTEAAIAAGTSLALIVRAGSGTNTIDVTAASARGVYVAACPGKNSCAVAELAMGMIIALDRRIADNVLDLRRGVWAKSSYSKAQGLKGRKLGLVGFGSIAREVAVRARGFDMVVQAYSRSLTEEEADRAGVTRAVSLEQLFRASDVISVHLPLTKETRGIISRDLLARMQRGALLINTARSEVVDQEALLEAVRAGRIRVGTDVWAQEPEGGSGEFLDPLGKEPGVVGTHHIGASTEEAQSAISAETARIVKTFLESGEVLGPVNILAQPPAAVGTLIIRHLDRVGVLASVLSALKDASINVEDMKNEIFTGGTAACARIRVTAWASPELLARLRSIEHILHVEIV